MKISIVTKKIDAGWEVSYACDTALAASATVPRSLRRCGPVGNGFPFSPQTEEALWEGKVHAELMKAADPAMLCRLYEDTIAGELIGNSIELFGQYLSAALLGDLWSEVSRAAGSEVVELDLYFEWDDAELHRLPWEIMYGADRPLCADRQRTVAITRFIIPREAAAISAPGLMLPLKVLFVIGMPLDNNLRPGAEYLGLLRRMNVPLKGKVESVDLNLRLLLDATSESLTKAVASFRPDVVHFICHGTMVNGKSSIYLTKLENKGKDKKPDPHDAEHLLDLIRGADGTVPQIVVLNACRTADISPQVRGKNLSVDKGAYLSFAAQLVAGGVPVAIGMAGEIADGACRIFTRSFYQALISGESISLAAAQGRRAALFQYSSKITDYLTSIEWARPTLFLAQGVSSSLSVDTEGETEMLVLTRAATRYRKTKTNPAIMCDRFECWNEYQNFCDGMRSAAAARQVLAFGVDENLCPGNAQFGMTRLLEEMAARAVLDGFIPCFMPSKMHDPPPNMFVFAIRLAEAIDVARENFMLAKRQSRAITEAFKIMRGGQPIPTDQVDFEKAKGEVVEKLSKYEALPDGYTNAAIKSIMIEDLRHLRCAVRKKWRRKRRTPPQRAATSPGGLRVAKASAPVVLVMIDDLHLYDAGVVTALLDQFVSQDGLGNRKIKVPMIFTYKFREGVVTALANPLKYHLRQNPANFLDRQLHPFREPHEDLLAYSQFFLSSNPPLAVNWRADKQAWVNLVFKRMRGAIKGFPSGFETSDELRVIREMFSDPTAQVLLEADDERYLLEMSQHQ